jgi:hypothetical protein
VEQHQLSNSIFASLEASLEKVEKLLGYLRLAQMRSADRLGDQAEQAGDGSLYQSQCGRGEPQAQAAEP